VNVALWLQRRYFAADDVPAAPNPI
jgi:hypothetical protein